MTVILTLMLLISSALTAYLTIAGKTCDEDVGTIFGRLTLRGWLATLCIVITALCGVTLFFLNERVSAQRDERQKRIDQLAMESRLPNEEGMHARELLAIERNSILISKSKEGAENWIDNYLNSVDDKVKQHIRAEEAKETLAKELHIFWLPHIEVLRAGFHDRAKKIANKYGGQYREYLPENLVLVAYSRSKSTISTLTLPGGFTLSLRFYPGVVSEIERIPPHLLIHAETPVYNTNALSYGFNNEKALLISCGGGPFEKRFEPYTGSTPIDKDSSYINHLNLALNSIFEIWLGSALNHNTLE